VLKSIGGVSFIHFNQINELWHRCLLEFCGFLICCRKVCPFIIAIVAAKVLGYVSPGAELNVHYEVWRC